MAAMQPSSQRTNVTLPPLHQLDGNYEIKSAFSDYASWLMPGALMFGRYPFVEPSRCTSREKAEEQITDILRAGITTFVGLQEELPPQRAMKISGQAGFLPYKPTADLIYATVRAPQSMEVMMGLRNPTLDKFLPTKRRKAAAAAPSADTASTSAATTREPPQDLQYLHYPIIDLGVPTREQLAGILNELSSNITRGEKIYMHCWGGRGRSGLVGACLLASLYNVSAEEALERVQRSFDTRKDAHRSKSPETAEQILFVQQYVAGLGKASA